MPSKSEANCPRADLFDVKGKVAMVTGSSRGIGRAIAETFAHAGARVVISSRKASACREVAEALCAAGHEALALPCHVGKRDELDALVDGCLQTWGQIDVLVCNAATNPVLGPLAEVDDAAYAKVMDTNLRNVLWLCNRVCPDMAARGRGSVILISSIAALRASRGLGLYGISKAAELALTRSLAAEWGAKGIRVNAIAPGLVKTDFARALWEDPERLEKAQQRTPLRRIGNPEDIAGVALFLASSAAAFITGQTLVVDGGESVV
ncbi:MAG TPA: SDR family oxidoreductase [Kiloniellaceae bacterium]|nr:SDR family oxidoreductase [Kiloniellaceae bacterium]